MDQPHRPPLPQTTRPLARRLNVTPCLAPGWHEAHSWGVTNKRWSDLDPRVRQAILIGGAFEAGLKLAALIDLVQQPRREIRGTKAGWAIALALVNSGGVLPIAYFLRGRRSA